MPGPGAERPSRGWELEALFVSVGTGAGASPVPGPEAKALPTDLGRSTRYYCRDLGASAPGARGSPDTPEAEALFQDLEGEARSGAREPYQILGQTSFLPGARAKPGSRAKQACPKHLGGWALWELRWLTVQGRAEPCPTGAEPGSRGGWGGAPSFEEKGREGSPPPEHSQAAQLGHLLVAAHSRSRAVTAAQRSTSLAQRVSPGSQRAW